MSTKNNDIQPSDELGLDQRGTRSSGLRLNGRHLAIIDLLFHARALRKDQINTALFPLDRETRCQRCLTALYRGGYIGRLPRGAVNEPSVYLLGRQSVRGNRLMRLRYGEAEFRRRMTGLGSLGHLLAVNEIYVRALRASRDLRWELPKWETPEELKLRLEGHALIPDAYFLIQRTVNGAARTAGFFLELERAGKSFRVVENKLARYAELYYSGDYESRFGVRALRVLFVFSGELGVNGELRVTRSAQAAEALGVTLARFARLEELATGLPTELLLGALWAQPGVGERQALFSVPQ